MQNQQGFNPPHHWILTQRPQLKPLLKAPEPTPMYAPCKMRDSPGTSRRGEGLLRRAVMRQQLEGEASAPAGHTSLRWRSLQDTLQSCVCCGRAVSFERPASHATWK